MPGPNFVTQIQDDKNLPPFWEDDDISSTLKRFLGRRMHLRVYLQGAGILTSVYPEYDVQSPLARLPAGAEPGNASQHDIDFLNQRKKVHDLYNQYVTSLNPQSFASANDVKAYANANGVQLTDREWVFLLNLGPYYPIDQNRLNEAKAAGVLLFDVW